MLTCIAQLLAELLPLLVHLARRALALRHRARLRRWRLLLAVAAMRHLERHAAVAVARLRLRRGRTGLLVQRAHVAAREDALLAVALVAAARPVGVQVRRHRDPVARRQRQVARVGRRVGVQRVGVAAGRRLWGCHLVGRGRRGRRRARRRLRRRDVRGGEGLGRWGRGGLGDGGAAGARQLGRRGEQRVDRGDLVGGQEGGVEEEVEFLVPQLSASSSMGNWDLKPRTHRLDGPDRPVGRCFGVGVHHDGLLKSERDLMKGFALEVV